MTGARFDRPNPYLFASYAVLDPGWDEHLGHLEIEGMGMITFYYTLLAIGYGLRTLAGAIVPSVLDSRDDINTEMLIWIMAIFPALEVFLDHC